MCVVRLEDVVRGLSVHVEECIVLIEHLLYLIELFGKVRWRLWLFRLVTLPIVLTPTIVTTLRMRGFES